MSYLKPCPFCGSDPIVIYAHGSQYKPKDRGKCWIACSNEYNCSINQRESFHLIEAITNWNKRALPKEEK